MIKCTFTCKVSHVTPLCNRTPGINLIRGKFSLGQGAKKELGGSKFIGEHCCFLGDTLKFLPLLKKNYVWGGGATKNNTGGTFKN